jgi:hypothetical protein
VLRGMIIVSLRGAIARSNDIELVLSIIWHVKK